MASIDVRPFPYHRFCEFCKSACQNPGQTHSDYLLVTNVWNERKNIPKLFARILLQSKLPKVWLWIDDGSNDGSSDVVREYAKNAKDVEVWLHTLPPKKAGSLDTIGRAYQKAVPALRERIDQSGIEYMSIVDVDNDPCPNYFARMMWLMEDNSDVGAAAGIPTGEVGRRRVGLPMGAGKVVRWPIARSIPEFWDIAPDTLLNIYALHSGYRLKTWHVPMRTDRPTGALSSKGVFRQGRLSYYVGRPFWAVVFRSLRRLAVGAHGTQMLRGYLYEMKKGTWRCQDPVVRRFYRRGTNPITALVDLLAYVPMRD